jgi:hypothetical protein
MVVSSRQLNALPLEGIAVFVHAANRLAELGGKPVESILALIVRVHDHIADLVACLADDLADLPNVSNLGDTIFVYLLPPARRLSRARLSIMSLWMMVCSDYTPTVVFAQMQTALLSSLGRCWWAKNTGRYHGLCAGRTFTDKQTIASRHTCAMPMRPSS